IGFCTHCKNGYSFLKLLDSLLSVAEGNLISGHYTNAFFLLKQKLQLFKRHILYEVSPQVRKGTYSAARRFDAMTFLVLPGIHPPTLKYMNENFQECDLLHKFLLNFATAMITLLEKNNTPF